MFTSALPLKQPAELKASEINKSPATVLKNDLCAGIIKPVIVQNVTEHTYFLTEVSTRQLDSVVKYRAGSRI